MEPLRRPLIGQSGRPPFANLIPTTKLMQGANPPESLRPSPLQIKPSLVELLPKLLTFPTLPAYRGRVRPGVSGREPGTRFDFMWRGGGLKLSGGSAPGPSLALGISVATGACRLAGHRPSQRLRVKSNRPSHRRQLQQKKGKPAERPATGTRPELRNPSKRQPATAESPRAAEAIPWYARSRA